MNLLELMKTARATNAERDATDRRAGFAAPADGDPGLLLRTAMLAISCGVTGGLWSCVAEGLAMLEQLHAVMHPGKPPFTVE